MIDWFYSDACSDRAVTNLYQIFLERTKMIRDTSNRSGVVSNVVCDDFMQLERPLGAEQVSACLAVPRDASPSPAPGLPTPDKKS